MTADVAGVVNKDLRGSDLHLGFDAFQYVSYGLCFVRSRNIADDQRPQVVKTAVEYLNQQSWVSKAFAKTDILNVRVRAGVPPDEMSLEERFAQSVDAERSPDILIAFKPYATMDRVDPNGYYIAEHGSPWNYDRRVPIVFWRPGLPG